MSYDRTLHKPIHFDHPRDKWEWMKQHGLDEDFLALAGAFNAYHEPEVSYRMHDLKALFQDKPLIGLAGKKHAGKSTIAAMLRDHRQYSELAFAEPLKDAVECLVAPLVDDYDQATLERKEDILPELGVSLRHLWQTLGDWAIEKLGEDILVRLVERDLQLLDRADYLRRSQGFVIADVRQEVEATWIRRHGGKILHIIADQPCDDGHRTERGIKCAGEDFILTNNGDHAAFIADAVSKLNEMVYGA